jgi:hypothetical protein
MAEPQVCNTEGEHRLRGGPEREIVDYGLVLIAMSPIADGSVKTTWK